MSKIKDTLSLSGITFSQPWKSSIWNYTGAQVSVDLDLSSMVDGYDYHDFPSSETVYFGLEDIVKLRDYLNTIIPKMEELEKQHVRED